jgi:hypothetical protein
MVEMPGGSTSATTTSFVIAAIGLAVICSLCSSVQIGVGGWVWKVRRDAAPSPV